MRISREDLARRFADNGAPKFVLKALRYPFKPLLAPAAARAFRREAAGTEDLDRAYDLAGGFNYAGITVASWQIRSEILPLLRVVESRAPKTIVEIGTAAGGTLFLLSRAATPDATLISVDLPGARFGGGYARWRSVVYRAFARGGQHIELLRADSHKPGTKQKVESLLGDRPIDFLFIDGDHSYEGVKADYEMYAPLVAADGLVAFHDIVPGTEDMVGGVPRFWSELKASHAVREFVADWEFGSCGIGLVLPGDRAAAGDDGAPEAAAAARGGASVERHDSGR